MTITVKNISILKTFCTTVSLLPPPRSSGNGYPTNVESDNAMTKFSKARKSNAIANQKKGMTRKKTLPKERKNRRFILYTE